MEKEILPLTTPLKNIALTFSGGGFRAASYCLGALSYLDYVKFGYEGAEQSLLKNVTYISSTSGGSIINALYSSYIHKGKTFADVYKKLMACLTGQQLLDEVFSVMKNDNEWNVAGNYKARNFINAFAKVYDRMLYEEETFGIFWKEENIKEFEICLNSTEFYRGLSFRFQTEGTDDHRQIIGNKFLHFDATNLEVVKKIKLADMVTASSCFPAGFEPIIYPEDFAYSKNKNTLSIEELQSGIIALDYQNNAKSIEDSVALMDGGITDNQALKSVMQADEKRRAREKNPTAFDLIMITDVASYFMDEYKVPKKVLPDEFVDKNINFYVDKISKILIGVLIVTLLIFITSIFTLFYSTNVFMQCTASALGFLSLLLFIFTAIICKRKWLNWIFVNEHNMQKNTIINKFIRKEKFTTKDIMIKVVSTFRNTNLAQIEKMITQRGASMKSMLLDVNLKQIRRLTYDLFYSDKKWENRRVSNYIYELSTFNNISRVKRLKSDIENKNLLLDDCGELHKIAEEARTMGTTLWFDEKNEGKLKHIIATGQFTTCCNLLEYVISLERKGIAFDTDTNKQLANLKAALTIDFLAFKKDPYFLYDKMQKM
jgi:predicted acylesterase/phospholipase RssA